MRFINPKENMPLYAISVIALASPLSGDVFRGLTAYNNYFIAAIILSAFLTVYAISTIFSKNERDAITVSKIDILIGVYLLYNLLGIFILHKTSHEPLFYAKWCLIVMLYVTARLITKSNTGKLLYLLIIGGLIQAAIVFAQHSGIIDSLNGSFNITGTFANPGHVAVYLSGSIVSAIILFKQGYKTAEKSSKIMQIIFIVILFTALCLCKSRTSFIALIAAVSDIAANSIATSTMICDLGDLCRKQKLYREAEKNYKLASDMVPCRIMPNYMLFKLYVEMEDYASAYRMAEKILSQPVSITGSMVLRIRNEVKEWLSNREKKVAP